MTDTPTASGADLARQALAAARAAAKTRPEANPKKTRRTTRPARGEGRDPQALDAVLGRLTAEQGWNTGLDGGNLIDQWPTIAPTELATNAHPVTYDPDRGILELRPTSPAYATQIRLFQHQLAKHLNTQLGRPAVRTIRVLPAGAAQTADAYTAVHTSTPTPEAPVKTRDTASAGYRATLEAAQAHRPDQQPTDPYLVEALARQEAALRANRQPASEDRDAHWAQLDAEQKTGPAPGSIEASIRAAIARKHQDQTGAGPLRLFGAA